MIFTEDEVNKIWHRYWVAYVLMLMSSALAFDSRKGWALVLAGISMAVLVVYKFMTTALVRKKKSNDQE